MAEPKLRALHVVALCASLVDTMEHMVLFSYLQSKVFCETPLEEGAFTGSAHCGSKETVILEASKFAAALSSLTMASEILHYALRGPLMDSFSLRTLEIVAMWIEFLFSVLLWMAHGLLGTGMVWQVAVTVVSILAVQKPDCALKYLYIEYTEGHSDMTRAKVLASVSQAGSIGALAATVLTTAYLSSQPLDYWPVFAVWSLFSAFSVAAAHCLAATRPPRPQATRQSWLAHTRQDMREFLFEARYRLFRWEAVKDLNGVAHNAIGKNFMPLAMLVHGTRIETTMVVGLAMQVAFLPLPMLGLEMSKRVGARRFALVADVVLQALAVLLALCIPGIPLAIIGLNIVTSVPGALFGALFSTVRQHMPHYQPEIRGRSDAFLSLLRAAADMVVTPLMLGLFAHALKKGGGYWLHARISLAYAVLSVIGVLLHFKSPLWEFEARKLDDAEREYCAGPTSKGDGGKDATRQATPGDAGNRPKAE